MQCVTSSFPSDTPKFVSTICGMLEIHVFLFAFFILQRISRGSPAAFAGRFLFSGFASLPFASPWRLNGLFDTCHRRFSLDFFFHECKIFHSKRFLDRLL
eukprot:TRINITY_DN3015_c0_g1_i1.p2 TRINITY_DN3015_c0_g1~~TRINITY_DN3015_c0_g1_i1.p2  ORF type:complete len:100 (+),score=5.46 TRINITY_DN3015_c0_g1_i1:166-465(+)